MIYFIQDITGGPIKIGYAAHSVRQRMQTLQIGNPYELVCLATMEGGPNIEVRLHRKFEKYQFRSEWFLPSDEILDFIKNIDSFDPKTLFAMKKKKIEVDIPRLIEELYAASLGEGWDFPTCIEKFKSELYRNNYRVQEILDQAKWFERTHRKRFEEKRAVIGLKLGNF